MSNKLIESAPERIWLQVDAGAIVIDEEDEDLSDPFPSDHDGISWCHESVGGIEVEYTKTDLNEWQPMETAPTDGTEIILFCDFEDTTTQIIASYDDSNHKFCWSTIDGGYNHDVVKFWRPLHKNPTGY